jgi:hypothetical protein
MLGIGTFNTVKHLYIIRIDIKETASGGTWRSVNHVAVEHHHQGTSPRAGGSCEFNLIGDCLKLRPATFPANALLTICLGRC